MNGTLITLGKKKKLVRPSITTYIAYRRLAGGTHIVYGLADPIHLVVGKRQILIEV
jgi:hypothetical protein